jgi:hypothetical protein
MQRQLIEPAGLQGVDASIFPYIGAVAPMLAELETVDVRGRTFLEREDEFVP